MEAAGVTLAALHAGGQAQPDVHAAPARRLASGWPGKRVCSPSEGPRPARRWSPGQARSQLVSTCLPVPISPTKESLWPAGLGPWADSHHRTVHVHPFVALGGAHGVLGHAGAIFIFSQRFPRRGGAGTSLVTSDCGGDLCESWNEALCSGLASLHCWPCGVHQKLDCS